MGIRQQANQGNITQLSCHQPILTRAPICLHKSCQSQFCSDLWHGDLPGRSKPGLGNTESRPVYWCLYRSSEGNCEVFFCLDDTFQKGVRTHWRQHSGRLLANSSAGQHSHPRHHWTWWRSVGSSTLREAVIKNVANSLTCATGAMVCTHRTTARTAYASRAWLTHPSTPGLRQPSKPPLMVGWPLEAVIMPPQDIGYCLC